MHRCEWKGRIRKNERTGKVREYLFQLVLLCSTYGSLERQRQRERERGHRKNKILKFMNEN